MLYQMSEPLLVFAAVDMMLGFPIMESGGGQVYVCSKANSKCHTKSCALSTLGLGPMARKPHNKLTAGTGIMYSSTEKIM